jgi:parallel beta-helix repeat protein
MKRTLNNIFIISFIFSLFLGLIIISSVSGTIKFELNNSTEGNTIYVGGTGPGNFSDIQEALDNANNGDTIFVYSGDYPANIVIEKSINLIGENREKTIIQDGSDGIFVFADMVTITNFTITHCGGFWDKAGILIRSNDNTIYNNNIVDNGVLNGIYLEFASFNKIFNNLIENCQYNGLKLSYSNYNNISGNMISTNRGIGIIFHDSSYNNIIINTVSKSFWGGTNIYDNSYDNLLFHNNLIENDIGNGYDICGNFWDNGIEGNHWDDYTGIDNNGDGIGDTPYIIIGNTTQDNYPLMDIHEIPSRPIIDGPDKGRFGIEYEYIFLSTDPDIDDIFIYVDWGDNTDTEWLGPYESGKEIKLQHSWTEKGTYEITARARDTNGYYSFSNTKEIFTPKIKIFNRLSETFPFLKRMLLLILVN